jgi:hypothetical protein
VLRPGHPSSGKSSLSSWRDCSRSPTTSRRLAAPPAAQPYEPRAWGDPDGGALRGCRRDDQPPWRSGWPRPQAAPLYTRHISPDRELASMIARCLRRGWRDASLQAQV